MAMTHCFGERSCVLLFLQAADPSAVPGAGKKPNIVVIWGDDIGVHNISAYNHGIMGYRRRTSIGSQGRGAVH